MFCKLKSTKLISSKYCYVSLTIQLNSHLLTQLSDQTVLFLTIEFSINHWFALSLNVSSISSTDRTLSGATSWNHSGSGSNDNEGVLCIPQSSSITGSSPSDCFVSNLGHSLEGSYPSANCSQCILQSQLTRLARLWVSWVWHKTASDGEAPVLEFREHGVPLHCHYSWVHSDPE